MSLGGVGLARVISHLPNVLAAFSMLSGSSYFTELKIMCSTLPGLLRAVASEIFDDGDGDEVVRCSPISTIHSKLLKCLLEIPALKDITYAFESLCFLYRMTYNLSGRRMIIVGLSKN
jgi:hypothetical protein